MDFTKKIKPYCDSTYKDFAASLNPNVNKENILGVRVPTLRIIAKNLNEKEKEEFLKSLPHKYYEENLIHGFIIQNTKDIDKCFNLLDEFLPLVDNWAVCDTMMPKIFKKYPNKVLPYVDKWINSKYVYSIRFAINVLMNVFLDDLFKEEYLYQVAAIKSDEYYIKMMIAWYYATALAKQYDSSIKIIENKLLSKWVHNKTIQKAKESFRVSNEHKEYLQSLKIH